MDLIARKKALLMAQDQFVPPGYQQYDYIECTGRNSRFDTGVAGNDNSLVFDFTYMVTNRVQYQGHFGNYSSENSKCWRLINNTSSYPRLFLFTNNIRKAGSSSSISVVSASTNTVVNKKVHFNISYGKCEVEAEDGFSGSSTQTDDGTTDVSTLNIAIGSTSPTTTGGTANGRFYGTFRILRGTKLIRNYVPVVRKSDSKAGFYDTVNHTFNPSIGSVEFVAGND